MQGQGTGSQNSLITELFLKYPESLGIHSQVSYENAVQYLLKAHQLAISVPFQWGYIDRPQDGSLFIAFLVPQQHTFPNDGIRYQDQERRFSIPTGQGREVEVSEIKFGYVPDVDTVAYRCRRRFRLVKGGTPQLILIHYFTGPNMQIMPAHRNQPARSYPLRPVNEPAMYVLGENAGKKVFTNRQAGPAQAMGSMIGMGGGMQHQAAMLAHQNREMEALERRQARERGSTAGSHGHPAMHDEDSGDELDHITTRSLALARYKRNHDYMNEVFWYAAFGKNNPKELKSPYVCFNIEEIKDKVNKLEKEVEELRVKGESQKEAALKREREESGEIVGDVSMESLGPAQEGLLV